MHKKVFLKLLIFLSSFSVCAQSFVDSPFLQPISKKYPLQTEQKQKWEKIEIDRDGNVYALSALGLFWLVQGDLVPDTRFLPLNGKVPVDICIQADAGVLYYLFDDHFLSNAHAGKPYGDFSKGKFNQMAVNNMGDVLLAGGSNFQIFESGKIVEGGVDADILELQASDGDFFLQTSKGLLRWNGRNFEYFLETSPIRAWAVQGDVAYVAVSDGIFGVSVLSGKQVLAKKSKIPVWEINALQAGPHGLWAATDMGVFNTANFDNFHYFESKRWLIENKALDVAINADGDAFVLSASGLSKIEHQAMTLAQKAEYFQKKVRKRHLRLGLIGETRFSKPGDLRTAELIDTDNDGLWTSFYLGSEVFRYASTKDPVAKQNAMESFESFERLLSINQLKGFPSRTFARKGFKVSDHDRWRESPETNWEWKGHTSSDEFVAYIWVAGILDKHLDLNPVERQRVADFIDAIMTHIIENDYYFIDIDGKPTLWGRWNPEYINMYPKTVGDRKLGSETITAGLQLAYALTGKELYKKEAYRLFEEHGYLDNIRIPYANIGYTPNVMYLGHDMGMGGWNHSDDEMAFFTYWILYHYAFDDELKKVYADVIEDHWTIEKPERNALWNLIAFGTSGDLDLASVEWHLREFQMDMVRWDMQNSHRKDLDLLPPNFRGQSTKVLLSPAERPVMRYNGNPFTLDGGRKGMRELAGDEYLLPYWMGRYLNVIVDEK
ncbi:hypothetical protein LAG90_10140 [Marinilongibacter aquaticus]|uniref:hypothetical protein n=1 Tax=Marinilongibacter aquaticus TaxID=2975157 RepID=UPI0021BD34A0|nr:hypothetical protein [Marinilongibacter aquaticus]UBM57180.1 hypothetical protein LAG90_10140 [Marinilongibacter aquaticus]